MKQALKKFAFSVISIGITFGIQLLLFFDLLRNLSTHLFDWHDYPLYVWIIYQNLEHWLQLDVSQLFQGNIFHSFPNVLLFSDLFWPQSLVALVLQLVIDNPITVFNLVFILTLLANTITAHYLWGAFTRDSWQRWFATTATVLSAFVFQNWYHFQILSLWPFLLALGYVLRRHQFTWTEGLMAGLLITIVLHSSVYLWAILMTILVVWLICQLFDRSRPTLPRLAIFYVMASVSFLATSSYTLYSYWQTRQMYQAQRDYHEYVTYSSHLSDWLFPAHTSSLVWGTPFVKRWNSFNQHTGIFPGLVLVGLALMGIVTFKKSTRQTLVGVLLTPQSLFFGCLLLMGVVFSLGPRLSFNGTYLRLPLPYHLLLKTVPLFEVIRVTSRWNLLISLGLTYFALQGLSKIKIKQMGVVTLTLLVMYIAETYPFSHSTEQRSYYSAAYQPIADQCSTTPLVLLEYPLTEFRDGANISTNLSYRTQMMLASLTHHCLLVNGYSGYIPKAYDTYEHAVFESIEQQAESTFWQLLSEHEVKLIKLNKKRLFADRVATIENWLTNHPDVTVLYNDDEYVVGSLQNGSY